MFSPRRHSPIYILGVSYGKDMIGGDGMGYFIEAEPSVNLYVEDINPQSGKAIVFLHGWPLSHLQFEYQFDDLSRKGYRCIGIDWRGFGRSDKPATGYNYNRLADDIRAVVEALQLNNFTLAGHSTGGAIALRYMSRYRGAGVSKLVLIDAAAPVGFTEETAAKLLQQASNDRPKMMREVTDTFSFNILHNRSQTGFSIGIAGGRLVDKSGHRNAER